ncbi:metallophosphoesterase family protein [Deinococcus maricopensis]|uniref:Metallophosphoesterase n=1 Tax=Deinococcus maricopensis (strain DSM 21211 / LMG 22137 / NRRL B-23946 / LB-34) TaxID=709986 RepID=E8U5E8_DEIML|nr:metallophosphoesterase [Deinococcus maricopensis]ADV66287.1 metallophosphoesterase [Deinococcus maricopensis DSM 21211]
MVRRLLPAALLVGAAFAQAPATPDAGHVRAVLFSDFNGAYGSTTYPPAVARTVTRIVNEWKPDLVLSAGDLIAGQKAALSDAQVRAMWAAFDQQVHAPLRAAGLPFAFTLGNHDASLTRDRAEARTYWAAHAPPLNYTDRAHFPFRYAFTVPARTGAGTLFVAVLDAPRNTVSAQDRAWLAAQLATPAARAACIRLVIGHLPLAGISAEKNRSGEVLRPDDARVLRRVLERGGVLAYLSGHHAAYYPGRLGTLNVLSSGGIGGRAYVGAPGTARSVVTVMDLDLGRATVTLTAYDADTGRVVPTSALPARIDGLGGPVTRVDGPLRR